MTEFRKIGAKTNIQDVCFQESRHALSSVTASHISTKCLNFTT